MEPRMSTLKSSRLVDTLAIGALGGIAGGAAEIGWVALYGASTGVPVEPVARGVVTSVIPALAAFSWSAELGVLIHLALAIALGVGLALALRLISRHADTPPSELGVAMLVLTAVWVLNFLVALPRINPTFVHLLPYSVTLMSKLLFGVAAAAVLRGSNIRRARIRTR
jgi:hypothetical protein